LNRLLLALGLVLSLSLSAPLQGHADDDYPTKPIRLIVPYPPGGGTDLSARIVADALGRRLGQQVVVENRPGATGAIGSSFVVKAAPDGYTLLWNSTDSIILVPALREHSPYKVPDDFSFIARFAENGMVLAINASLPVKTLPEFIDYAKAHPGELHFGSTGIGGSVHMGTLLFEKFSGTQMIHVPYPGVAPLLVDLLGGRIEFGLITPITIAPYVNSDKIRMLAITSQARHPLLPDIQTLKEAGLPEATTTVWYGLFGPANLPAPVMERLQKEVAALADDATLRAKLEAAGLQVAPVVGLEFQKNSIAEYDQWKAVAKADNLSVTQ